MHGFSGAWSTHWTTTDGQFEFQPVRNNEVHDAQGPIIAGGRLVRILERGKEYAPSRQVMNQLKKKKILFKKIVRRKCSPFLGLKFRMPKSTQL